MPRLRFGFGISRINDSDGQEIIGREPPVVREGFVSNQFQEILPIGLIMNDRLRIVAVTGELVERMGGILFEVGEPCGRSVGGVRYILKQRPHLFFLHGRSWG
jgi:hypothetical protein